MKSKISPAINELLARLDAQILPSQAALKLALIDGKQLTFSLRIDPSSEYLHLGHSTNLLVLQLLQKLGHRVIVVFDDFTALTGTPSDRHSKRSPMNRRQITEHIRLLKLHIDKLFDPSAKYAPVEYRVTSEWLALLTFQDVVELAANFTIQELLADHLYKKRLEEQKPLYVHELLTPIIQGYASVVLEVDAEIGQTDTFLSMQAGRALLKRYKGREKIVVGMGLVTDSCNEEVIGADIQLNDTPNVMFVKIMQLPDTAILQFFMRCTRLPFAEVMQYGQQLKDGVNPRDIKLQLAYHIVAIHHSAKDAETAKLSWIAQISEKKLSRDLPTLTLPAQANLLTELAALHTFGSKSAIRRLVSGGAIRINGNRSSDDVITVSAGDILTIGKKHAYEIKLK